MNWVNLISCVAGAIISSSIVCLIMNHARNVEQKKMINRFVEKYRHDNPITPK